MQKTIRLAIARGHRPEVDAVIEENPGIEIAEAVRIWVERRYGAFIAVNMPGQFEIANVGGAGFDIEFEDDVRAKQFHALVGGSSV